MLLFTLTMPNVGSWNGQWTGQGRLYALKKKVSKNIENELDDKYFHYNFGDGWSAGISVKSLPAREVTKIMKNSRGFCGYEWMVDSILKNGEIRCTTT